MVSGNGPTLLPVGADGFPLSPAMTWMDRRGVTEAGIISEKSGRPTDPMFYLPKAFWVFRNQPAVYEKTRWFFSCPEFIAYALTGVAVTFLPTPQYTRFIWEENLIRDLNVFLVGDATLATFPASTTPRFATQVALVNSALRVLVTQVSWVRTEAAR